MKKSRFFLLSLVCLIALASSCATRKNATFDTAAEQRKKEKIAELNRSVFGISIVVETKDAPKKFSVGTGFLVAENLLASALHVQARAEELANKFSKSYKVVGWQKFRNGELMEFPIEIVAEDKENDLIIFRFDSKFLKEDPKLADVKPLALAENLPAIGETVVSIGYYANYQFPFNSIGNVAMIDANDDIFSDLTLMPGNSGAPVYGLETGELIGITTDVLDLGNETVRYGIAKRATKLRALLAKL